MTVGTLRDDLAQKRSTRQTRAIPLCMRVFGNDKSLPTVTVYNHMDVQPASKETEPWDTEPFVMTRKGDSYLDAAQLTTRDPLSLRFTAPAPHSKLVSVNIRFLWEFEEEIGSPNFEKINKARSRLAN